MLIQVSESFLGPFDTIVSQGDGLLANSNIVFPFTVIGNDFVIHQTDELLPPPPVPEPAQPPVPASVTPRQFRFALNNANLRTTAETAVSEADQYTKDWWEYATSIDRDNAQLNAMATALNITQEQVDALFIDAALQ